MVDAGLVVLTRSYRLSGLNVRWCATYLKMVSSKGLCQHLLMAGASDPKGLYQKGFKRY